MSKRALRAGLPEWIACVAGIGLAAVLYSSSPPREKVGVWAAFYVLVAVFGGGWVYHSYRLLGGLVNWTVLELSRGVLCVRTGPLPWWREKRLTASEVQQVACVATGPPWFASQWARRVVVHDVVAYLSNGREQLLAQGLDDESVAQSIRDRLMQGLSAARGREPSPQPSPGGRGG